jgi:hypothetical protein
MAEKMHLKTMLIITVVAALTSFVCSTMMEHIRNKNESRLSEQERVWNTKMPIYMSLAEELEELYALGDENLDSEDQVKSFNKIYNKLFIFGNDKLIKQLNKTDNTKTNEYISKAMILLRRELNVSTNLEPCDYQRKKLRPLQTNK